jgi:serine/threonine protein kinase
MMIDCRRRRRRRQRPSLTAPSEPLILIPQSRNSCRRRVTVVVVTAISSMVFHFPIVMVQSEQAYPLGCSTKPSAYYDFESASFPPSSRTTTEEDDEDGTIPSIQSADNFLLVRRLGAGKFSDVFEAVDVTLEQKQQRQRQRQLRKHISSSGGEDNDIGDDNSDSGMSVDPQEGKRIKIRTTIDPETLVVLKCLKPVSERKIKREVLVLRHCSSLPNLARLRAIVVPNDYVSSSSSPSSSLSSSSSSSNNNHNSHTPMTTTTNNSNNNKFKLQSMPSLVLEHAGVDSQWLCHFKDSYLTEQEIQYYLYHLLVGLDALHASGIMHRDVKPRNVLVNRIVPLSLQSQQNRYSSTVKTSGDSTSSGTTSSSTTSNSNNSRTHTVPPTQPLMLIDLGLADFFFPDTKYNVRVSSRHYKAPELLLGYERYDYAIDVWGVGCILAGLLLRREPFFRGYVPCRQ